MIAIITVGDCELIVLRRVKGQQGALELVCHTEMQRIDGHAQTPLQLARVDDRIDPNFNEELSIEVIERGSAVNCVSAYEGDIVLMGLRQFAYDSSFLFFPTEIIQMAERWVAACHGNTRIIQDSSAQWIDLRDVLQETLVNSTRISRHKL